jgi:hypothetical protein
MIYALLVITLSCVWAVLLYSQINTQAHIILLQIMSKRTADNCTSDILPAPPKLVRTKTCVLPADVDPWNADNYAEFLKLRERFRESLADLCLNRDLISKLIPTAARSATFTRSLSDLDDVLDALEIALVSFRSVEIQDIPGHLMEKHEWDGDSFTVSDSEQETEEEPAATQA